LVARLLRPDDGQQMLIRSAPGAETITEMKDTQRGYLSSIIDGVSGADRRVKAARSQPD
jgi:hypothetical protein